MGMMDVKQQIMCVLLKNLQDRDLISETVYDQAREKILGTWDWPDFFCCAGDAEGGDQNGSTENPR